MFLLSKNVFTVMKEEKKYDHNRHFMVKHKLMKKGFCIMSTVTPRQLA